MNGAELRWLRVSEEVISGDKKEVRFGNAVRPSLNELREFTAKGMSLTTVRTEIPG